MRRHPVFVTRKFPPSIGGMETLAAGVWRSIGTVRPDAMKISHGGPNRDLVWWLPWSLARLLALIVRRRVEVVLAGDALMYAMAAPLLRMCRVRHATMIMGLDVTFDNRLYRAVVHTALRRAPRVIAISAATAEQAKRFGVPAERISVLRLGAQAPEVSDAQRRQARAALGERLGLNADDVLVLTLGRLVRRKGVRWFTEEVLAKLPTNVHYLIAGDGEEEANIRAAAVRAEVADRVHLLGRVGDAVREELLCGSDLFVQPNVPVAGDMEGFGLATVEAAMRGTPVVAADLEGIKDAVVDGRTGILLPPADSSAWVVAVGGLVSDRVALAERGVRFKREALALYSEQAMGRALGDQLGLRLGPLG